MDSCCCEWGLDGRAEETEGRLATATTLKVSLCHGSWDALLGQETTPLWSLDKLEKQTYRYRYQHLARVRYIHTN